MGHHELFWVSAAEGHGPAQTRNTETKFSRHSRNGTLCVCTGSVLLKDTAWHKQEIQNAACLIIQLLPTTLPKQVSYWYCCLGNSHHEITQKLRVKRTQLIKVLLN